MFAAENIQRQVAVNVAVTVKEPAQLMAVDRIVGGGVEVVEVFVAQGESVDPLGNEFGNRVLDPLGIAMVGETGGESAEDADLGFHLPQEEAAGVRSDGSAVESGRDGPTAEPLESELPYATHC